MSMLGNSSKKHHLTVYFWSFLILCSSREGASSRLFLSGGLEKNPDQEKIKPLGSLKKISISSKFSGRLGLIFLIWKYFFLIPRG